MLAVNRLHIASVIWVFLLLLGCTGGSDSGTGSADAPLKLVPEELTLFSNSQGEFQIAGGRRPFTATVNNPGALVLQGGLEESKVRVFANDVSTDTSVRVTVKDAVNTTTIGTAKIKPTLVTNEIMIEALPTSGGGQAVNRCQDGTTLCAGSFARVTVKLRNPAGSAAGRPVRFDVIEGQFAYTTDPNFTQF